MRFAVRRLEWVQDETYPKGERWVGSINGRQWATVTALSETWGGRVVYRVEATDSSGQVASIESGKRAAQSAVSKLARSLIEGAG